MRKIKFRAWDKEKKQWIRPTFYGEILVGGYEVAIVNNKPKNGGYHLDSFILFNHKETDNIEVSQYTGLLDKNGKEIYEGDIVRTHFEKTNQYEAYTEIGVVNITPHRTEIEDKRHGKYNGFYSHSEIIGNIYENPELLKV